IRNPGYSYRRPTGFLWAFAATLVQSFYLQGGIFVKPDLRLCPPSEVQARVAIQLVKLRVKALNSPNIPSSSIVYSASYLLPHTGFTMLRFALHSLAAHLDMGYSSSEWVKGV